MIAIDTTLLIYAHRATTAQHQLAQGALEMASRDPRGWGIPQPCLAEFWGMVTHPEAKGRPSKPKEARAFLEALAQAGAQFWQPMPGFGARFIDRVRKLKVKGPRSRDVQIAMIALENGAREIWTHDADFLTVRGLKLKNPLQSLQS